MSTGVYTLSVLASLVLIAAPVAHKLFTAEPGIGAASVELDGQELDGRQLRIELTSPSGERRSEFRGGAAGGRRW